MTKPTKNPPESENDFMKVTVSRDGPYIVTGGVPLVVMEICNDEEGNCRTWRTVKEFPAQETYALCRCGNSGNKPFCDGTHTKVHFHGTEAGNEDTILDDAIVTHGPHLTLTDNQGLCVHARFCMRAGGIWNLVERKDPEARKIAIEEACNCPSGRLVVSDNATGEVIEPDLEKSIVVIEYPPRGEHGPLWVRGGIPVVSSDGTRYRIRNRLTLCRCGRSGNKPFCDGSHIRR
jgi:CDGSH-type Zn-finger protein